jgi:predicted nucleotidyltransferase
MRLDPKQEKYGQPVLKIREILRLAMTEKFKAKTKTEILQQISEILQQPKTIAKVVLEQMIKDAYLLQKKKRYAGRFLYELSETDKGRRFGIATANPKISREKADQLLKELIEKVELINENEDLAYLVERVSVFGSYLSDKPMLGDIDVAIKLTRRKQGEEFVELNNKRIALAIEEGRGFSNYVERIFWPHREVILMLKTKKKGLSIHDEENDDVINRTESRKVYEYK